MDTKKELKILFWMIVVYAAFFHRFMTSCLPYRAPNRAA